MNLLVRSPRCVAPAVVLGSLVIRVVAVAALRGFHGGPSADSFGSDGVEFEALAASLAEGRGYADAGGNPTAFRAPGFPAVLSLAYVAFGRSSLAAYLLFCTLGALETLATYRLGLVLLGRTGGIVAGLLAAVYFPSVYTGTLYASENLYGLLSALTMLAAARYASSGSVVTLAWGGLCLGGMVLTRPMAAFVAVALAVMILGVHWPHRRGGVALAVFVTSSCLPVVPWVVRNQRVLGSPIVGTTNGGSTFYGSNNSRVLTERSLWGGWVSTRRLPGREMVDATPDEVSHDRLEWRLGLTWVREHVPALPGLAARKLIRFWLPDVWSPSRRYRAMQLTLTSPILVLTLAGVVLSLRRRAQLPLAWWSVHATLLATMAGAIVFWGAARFRDSIGAALVVYAALALRAVTRRVGWSEPSRAIQETSRS